MIREAFLQVVAKAEKSWESYLTSRFYNIVVRFKQQITKSYNFS